ncbi:MAG: 4-(cytidine 5'-diphospho)-2-C-methyl-D-erythritol kinase [Bacteroidetes bacterium]|nr:4-(cytidine 5'-diphospho)-2-C-methyl-D-erythritol kinase [Bacteroidota bacterium]
MIVYPNAKINLGLRITGKRADGYHNLCSVFYPIPLADILEIIVNTKPDAGCDIMQITGVEIPGIETDNSVLKAIANMRIKHAVPPLLIHLHKQIPGGAGLGGGSADAAFAIRLLNEMLKMKLKPGEMHEIAMQTGSDCGFFIENKPAHVTGRGEIMKSIDLNLSAWQIVILKPEVSVNTAYAYSQITPKKQTSTTAAIVAKPVEKWKGKLLNDFYPVVAKQHPEMKYLVGWLYNHGAEYANMSGSGSAVFGLFRNETKIPHRSGEVFCWSGIL